MKEGTPRTLFKSAGSLPRGPLAATNVTSNTSNHQQSNAADDMRGFINASSGPPLFQQQHQHHQQRQRQPQQQQQQQQQQNPNQLSPQMQQHKQQSTVFIPSPQVRPQQEDFFSEGGGEGGRGQTGIINGGASQNEKKPAKEVAAKKVSFLEVCLVYLNIFLCVAIFATLFFFLFLAYSLHDNLEWPHVVKERLTALMWDDGVGEAASGTVEL